ncbi:hypothetical protein L1887_52052 [Cichorium endivia]|nr:hypothetical protein L1887_52052 [Cichorium endivia]
MDGVEGDDELDVVAPDDGYAVALLHAELAREPGGDELRALVHGGIRVRLALGDDERSRTELGSSFHTVVRRPLTRRTSVSSAEPGWVSSWSTFSNGTSVSLSPVKSWVMERLAGGALELIVAKASRRETLAWEKGARRGQEDVVEMMGDASKEELQLWAGRQSTVEEGDVAGRARSVRG